MLNGEIKHNTNRAFSAVSPYAAGKMPPCDVCFTQALALVAESWPVSRGFHRH